MATTIPEEAIAARFCISTNSLRYEWIVNQLEPTFESEFILRDKTSDWFIDFFITSGFACFRTVSCCKRK